MNVLLERSFGACHSNHTGPKPFTAPLGYVLMLAIYAMHSTLSSHNCLVFISTYSLAWYPLLSASQTIHCWQRVYIYNKIHLCQLELSNVVINDFVMHSKAATLVPCFVSSWLKLRSPNIPLPVSALFLCMLFVMSLLWLLALSCIYCMN